MGLAPRMGEPTDSFWYVHDLALSLQNGAKIDKKSNKLIVTLGRKNHPVTLKHIEIATEMKQNPLYNEDTHDSFQNARLFDEKQPTPLLRKIAPYADNSHLVPSQNAIRAKGLQENQLLAVKWFTRNFLGTELIHLVNGKAAWFLSHLMDGDLLQIRWCPIHALLESLRLATTTGGFPLPVLMCQIVGMFKKLDTIPEPHEHIYPPKGMFYFFQCDIPGFWTGPEPPIPRRIYLEDTQAWKVWRFQFGSVNLGGGWSYHTKGGLDEGHAFISGEGADTGPYDSEDDDMETDTNIGAGVEETRATKAEQARTVRRRRHRQTTKRDTSDLTLPYTYSLPAAPFTPSDPTVAWHTAAYLEPGLHSRVPPQHQSEVVLHAIPYIVRLLDGIHGHFHTGFSLDDDLYAPGFGPPRNGASGSVGADGSDAA